MFPQLRTPAMFPLLALLLCVAPLCYSFVLVSSPTAASGVDDVVFVAGRGHLYRLQTTVLLNEAASRGKDVGFQVTGEVGAGAVWQAGPERILLLQLIQPQLHIKSRKAPSPEGFVAHASKLDSSNNNPFYVHWNNGKIENVYVAEGEDLSLVNIKKGIASLFQFQLLDVEVTEKDVSGKCLVKYTTINTHSFLKTKSECISPKSVPYTAHPDKVLSALVTSKRISKYVMTRDQAAVDSVIADETHEMSVALRQDAGSSIKATVELARTGAFELIAPIQADSFEVALNELKKISGQELSKQMLITEREPRICQDDCPNLQTVVKENKKFLKKSNLGTVRALKS